MVYRIPAVNLVGRGCLAQLKDEIGTLGCKKALVVSDKFLTENGVVEKVTKVLDQVGIEHTLYNDVKQNPSVANVEGGLEVLKKENCEYRWRITTGLWKSNFCSCYKWWKNYRLRRRK